MPGPADTPRQSSGHAPPGRAEVLTPRERGLGTFGGVFTPSILTILGVIMYLRFGWVVAQVGLAGTLVIVTLSTSITFITALSVAAIATNQRVRAGGAYYMISRSLGTSSRHVATWSSCATRTGRDSETGSAWISGGAASRAMAPCS